MEFNISGNSIVFEVSIDIGGAASSAIVRLDGGQWHITPRPYYTVFLIDGRARMDRVIAEAFLYLHMECVNTQLKGRESADG